MRVPEEGDESGWGQERGRLAQRGKARVGKLSRGGPQERVEQVGWVVGFC